MFLRRREIGAALRAIVLVAMVVAILVVPRDAGAVGDPSLVWETWTTKHFQLHAHKGLESVAMRILDVAESAHTRLAPHLGWEPKERTQIVLTDDSDFANGSATALPFNTVRLFVCAPDDLSPLADYDDWQIELVTHEYTHILHTDNITGLPAIYNAIFGKTYSPNQMQPRWLLEGLAVLQESYFTSGGRNHSTTFDMYLRADVLEDNIAPIDQVSHTPRRWPQGNLWYLYGSHFLEYIQDIYGPEALRSVAADYGSQIIPYGINRSIHRATGKTYLELYDGWTSWMKEKYGKQKKDVTAKGLREGKRLTFTGYESYHPRYAPKGGADPSWGKRPIVFSRNDGHTPVGLYVVDAANPNSPRMLTRTSGPSTPAFLPDGSLVYDSIEVSKHVYFFWDLFRRERDDLDGEEWEQGERLTTGMRASEPDVSPDGTRVVFTVDKAGTRSLFVASIENADGGAFEDMKELVDSKRYEQVYTPRWSPDGKSIAFSRWTSGGYRDVVIVDVASQSITEVTHDRALDTGPAWSSDGKYLFFSSDRTGIPNVYRYTLATGVLVQVTNVTNGAFQPTPSADGEHLVYVGYTHEGYDLFEIDLDEKKFLDAEPYVDTRGPRPPEPKHLEVEPTPYNPWPTLRPYTWSFTFRPDAFGNAVVVTTQGGDVVGHHAFSLSISSSFERGEPGVDFAYLYRRLPFDMRAHLFRFIAPRGGYRFDNQTPVWIEQTIGADTGINYPINRAFDSQNLALTYSFARFAAETNFPVPGYDPYSTPAIFPQTGFIGAVHLGYSWSNAQAFTWSVGAEKGYAFSVGIDYARKELASDYELMVAGYSAVGYFPMPWARHHVLAFHAQGGATAGDYGRRGAFALGGYTEIPLPDAIRNLLIQPGIALRGYPPGFVVGDGYQLFNVEYRFPILNVDRGVETLPAFLERIYGNVFFDYGNATFDHLDLLHFKTGVGFELFTDFVIGYFEALTLKVGFAYGLSDGGVRPSSGDGIGSYFGQTYVVLSQLF
jgi:Tol biopolymer transport system component